MVENKKCIYSKNTLIKIGIIGFLVGLYIFVKPVNSGVKRAIFILSMLDIESIKGYILSFGIWAPVVSFLLMVLQSVLAPLPAFLITFSNAALFGWVKGAVLSWSSAMAGALLCFYISKIFGRSITEKLTNKYALKEVDVFFKRHGKYAILIARLLPFISFDIVSYAAGLTSINIWSFLWATGIGQLPATIIYSYVGQKLTGGTKTFVCGLLILFSLSVLICLMKKIWNEKKIENHNKEIC